MTIRATASPRFAKRVRDARWDEDEGARPGDDLLVVDREGQLALEHVERVVLGRMRVLFGPFAVRLDRDQG